MCFITIISTLPAGMLGGRFSTTDANIMNMANVMMHHTPCHGCLTLLINTV